MSQLAQAPAETGSPAHRVAIVAIGRNEGDRMVRCLEAAFEQAPARRSVIYIDSGSTDGSLQRATALGATGLGLDASAPFTAARARNLGLAHVRAHFPQVHFIQFLDADCELSSGWIDAAQARLLEDQALAGVAGILRERYPEASPYNKLCDMEWQAPPGEARVLGGNAMFRVAALVQVNGYDATLIAGEEPEMCVRLRQRGWRLWRLEAPMALHDAAMTRFGQWWKRSVRFGYAQAQVSRMHRNSPQRIWVRETRSTILWTLLPPALAALATIALARMTGGWWWLLGLVPLLLYDVLALKIYLSRRRSGQRRADAALYAAAAVVAKFPQFAGLLKYARSRAAGRPARIIEYKAPGHRRPPARHG